MSHTPLIVIFPFAGNTSDGDDNSTEADGDDKYKLYEVPADILVNKYNRGWRGNFAEVIWPISIRPWAKRRGAAGSAKDDGSADGEVKAGESSGTRGGKGSASKQKAN